MINVFDYELCVVSPLTRPYAVIRRGLEWRGCPQGRAWTDLIVLHLLITLIKSWLAYLYDQKQKQKQNKNEQQKGLQLLERCVGVATPCPRD
jgi:hypothetical protein